MFDIIIGERENLGRGYGSDALRTLVQYLFEVFFTLEMTIIGAAKLSTVRLDLGDRAAAVALMSGFDAAVAAFPSSMICRRMPKAIDHRRDDSPRPVR
jgi:hypothetical protein